MSYFSGIDQRMRQQTFFNNSTTITQPLTQLNTTLIANLQYVQNYVGNLISNYLPVNNPIFSGTLSTASGNISAPTANITTANITNSNITTANITTANTTYQNATQFNGNPTININSKIYPIQFRVVGEIKIIMPANINYAPPNFLLCDGSSYATTAYPKLFSAIAYAYGGSGSNFNVPSFGSRFLIGGNGAKNNVSASNYASGNGQRGYNNDQFIEFNYNNETTNSTPILTTLPKHSHETYLDNSVPSTIAPVGVQTYTFSTATYQGIATADIGNNIQTTDPISGIDGVNICPSYIACNFWICYQ